MRDAGARMKQYLILPQTEGSKSHLACFLPDYAAAYATSRDRGHFVGAG